jgi:hypothetical protein
MPIRPFFRMVLLLAILAMSGCASQPGQWDVKRDYFNNNNWPYGVAGSGGNGLF